jgi:cysteine desulfurase
MAERVYLDHAATSPLRPEAKAAMDEGFAIWANPSSPHAEGRKARAALEDARERIKAALGWEGELIFTSGASEALWIALNRAKVERRIVSAVEHDAVFRAAPDATVVPIDLGSGLVDQAQLMAALAGSRSICAIQAVNSETGTLQARAGHGKVIRDAGSLLLVDCSQSAGQLAENETDFAVFSAHKFGGPIGIGALLVRDFALLDPIGGHERGYRQGTENLPAAMGMAAALEATLVPDGWASLEVAHAFDKVIEIVIATGGTLVGPGHKWHPILAIAHPTISAQALLIRLDAMGFAVSAGSACSSGTLKKSRVLDAFGVPDDVAARTIRVSLGWNTTPEDMERFADAWVSLA